MFDLAWSEIALIAVVALVVIGPKDLPDAIRGLARGIQKLRRMAGEFQTHVDEMVREAKLDEVRDQINQFRNFDLKGEIERAVDSDGSIRKTFEEDPLRANPMYGPPAPETLAGAGATAGNDSLEAGAAAQAPGGSIADTFGPPGAAAPEPAEPLPPPEPPAFIPPEVVRAAEAAKETAAPEAPPSPSVPHEPSREPAATPQPALPQPAPPPQQQHHRHTQTTI